MTVKLIVGSRNRSDARNDLIRKRPQSSLLKNKLSASEYFHFCLFDALKLIRNLFFHEKGHEDNYCSTVHSSITHRLGIEWAIAPSPWSEETFGQPLCKHNQEYNALYTCPNPYRTELDFHRLWNFYARGTMKSSLPNNKPCQLPQVQHIILLLDGKW